MDERHSGVAPRLNPSRGYHFIRALLACVGLIVLAFLWIFGIFGWGGAIWLYRNVNPLGVLMIALGVSIFYSEVMYLIATRRR